MNPKIKSMITDMENKGFSLKAYEEKTSEVNKELKISHVIIFEEK